MEKQMTLLKVFVRLFGKAVGVEGAKHLLAFMDSKGETFGRDPQSAK